MIVLHLNMFYSTQRKLLFCRLIHMYVHVLHHVDLVAFESLQHVLLENLNTLEPVDVSPSDYSTSKE